MKQFGSWESVIHECIQSTVFDKLNDLTECLRPTFWFQLAFARRLVTIVSMKINAGRSMGTLFTFIYFSQWFLVCEMLFRRLFQRRSRTDRP